MSTLRDTDYRGKVTAGVMVFLGAFLAFGMEPIVGRMVTPFFGGAVHVWTTSLMVFQGLLLLGYLYAHLVAPRIGAAHLLVLLLPLLQWPLGFVSEIAPQASVAVLIAELMKQISLPFAVLCTTAVVAQSWWSRSLLGRAGEPYPLYGISNVGALTALLAYPFMVEPIMGVNIQRWVWSAGYLLYAAVVAWTWHLLRSVPDSVAPVSAGQTEDESLPKLTVLRWLMLSAAPSALLLAVTNVIATEVGSFPLVWVLPLALYLASFIVAFRDREGVFERLGEYWPDLAVLALAIYVFGVNWVTLPLILFVFFALCVSAHKQLYRLRPHPRRLTGYYLALAVGGWVGGVLVSLVAPMVFSGLWEYPLAVLAVAAARWQRSVSSPLHWWKEAPIWKGGPRLAGLMIGGAVLCNHYWNVAVSSPDVYALRNFYGVSRVLTVPEERGMPSFRVLIHGATAHGMQYLAPGRRVEPLGYYYRGGALYQALSLRQVPSRVAMLGLGAGGALPWFDAGESMDIYEIDPDIEWIARNWFTYLEDSPAQVRVRIGDARLKLMEEAKRGAAGYDIIFLDAFAGDGVPTHLLTTEALDIYLGLLAKNGILVFHISNRFYDLRPVLKAAAQMHGLAAVYTSRLVEPTNMMGTPTLVVVMARHKERLAPLLEQKGWARMGEGDGLYVLHPWTDDYVNILAPLLAKWTG
ncbi:MAG: hypothetical protein A3H31_00450 [Gallionellales bacterium RIFCSPLOWO2_02_FULL_57_47]|nr:MAG: hypothetical protein A3H31_00450 [Gallionellales bacterium RIFCSPLOWO2_02_FULL_57_47]